MTWQEQLRLSDQKALCKRAGVDPTPGNLHRILNAESIMCHNRVRYIKADPDGTKHFEVGSQTDEGVTYHVTFNGSPATYCDCKDWHHNDLRDAEKGIPFSLHQCKHGLAVRLAWNLNRYRIDEQADDLNSKAQIKHKLDRDYGAGNWKIKSRKNGYQGQIYMRYDPKGKWYRTACGVRKCKGNRYYLGRYWGF